MYTGSWWYKHCPRILVASDVLAWALSGPNTGHHEQHRVFLWNSYESNVLFHWPGERFRRRGLSTIGRMRFLLVTKKIRTMETFQIVFRDNTTVPTVSLVQ
jgi:hypothetical protein